MSAVTDDTNTVLSFSSSFHPSRCTKALTPAHTPPPSHAHQTCSDDQEGQENGAQFTPSGGTALHSPLLKPLSPAPVDEEVLALEAEVIEASRRVAELRSSMQGQLQAALAQKLEQCRPSAAVDDAAAPDEAIAAAAAGEQRQAAGGECRTMCASECVYSLYCHACTAMLAGV